MRYIEEFRARKIPSECLIAPRPPAGRRQSIYYAILAILEGSENYLFFSKLKKFEYLDDAEYERQKQDIQHSWSV